MADQLTEEGSECFSAALALDFSLGNLSQELSSECLAHCASCARCAELLRTLTYDKGDFTPQEQDLIRRIVPPQASLLASLAGPSETNLRKFLRQLEIQRWPLFAAALCIIVLAPFVFRMWIGRDIDRSLAEAYTERRVTEVRFRGAEYALLKMNRGRNSRPQALISAEEMLAKEQSRRSHDPQWLDANGLRKLLDLDVDGAIQDLEQAHGADGKSLAITVDLASAYFVRGELRDRPTDYGIAAEMLGEALQISPNNSVALFNRALAYERLEQNNEALRDWNRFLSQEPTGGWADEGRRHKIELQKKLDERHRSGNSSFLNVEAFERMQQNARRTDTLFESGQLEDLLGAATRSWLPEAIRLTSNRRSAPENPWKALQDLSGLLATVQNERWLADFLVGTSSLAFHQGVETLVRSLTLNEQGNYESAAKEAATSRDLFEQAGNHAGVARASFEHLYTLHRSARGHDCLQAANELMAQIRGNQYAWLNVQVDLERVSCLSMIENFSEAQEIAQRAVKEASDHNLPTLKLRAEGLLATIYTAMGANEAAWKIDLAGLKDFWSGSYPPMRAYQFYSDMGVGPEHSGQTWLALALSREADNSMALTNNGIGAAVSAFQHARSSLEAGEYDEAQYQLQRAKELLSRLPAGRITNLYASNADLGLAEAEIQRGRSAQALQRLIGLREHVREVDDYYLRIRYHLALASAERIAGNMENATAAQKAVIAIARSGLGNIKTDRERILWSRESESAYRALVVSQLSNDLWAAFTTWQEFLGAPVNYQESQGIRRSAANTEDLRADLDPFSNVAVLTFANLDHRFYVWVYANKVLTGRWLDLDSMAFGRQIDNFSNLCSDPTTDPGVLATSAKHLYSVIFSALEPSIAHSKLLVVEPDGALWKLPWYALQTREGAYLVERYPVVVSPGLAFWRRAHARAGITRSSTALLVGAPALDTDVQGLPFLPNARNEVTELHKTFPRSVLLIGNMATASNVTRLLPSANVFHYAGHAAVSSGRTQLIMAPEALPAGVDGTQLRKSLDDPALFRACGLVVLSACKTADLAGIQNPDSLVLPFLSAGVPQVIGSLWEIDSQETSDIMRILYREMMAGASPEVALQRSLLAMLHVPGTSHPSHWAAFQNFGRPQI